MQNRNIQVTKPSLPPFEEYINEIKDIWDSCHLTNSGPKHQKLEDELCRYLECENSVLFTNGHLALEIALKSLNLSGEVITSPFTFSSTTQAIVNCGLVPIFCDIDSKNYCIDANKIEGLITENTVAILPIHVYGNICDYKKISEIANKYKLKVIYDAAHAFGIRVHNRSVATLGDISMFSFHATKVFNTVEGGCLTFANNSIRENVVALKQFGMYDKEEVAVKGINAKMSEFHAAMGLCNLKYVAENIRKRKTIVLEYKKRLHNIPGIKICDEQEGVDYNYAYFPVVFDDKTLGFTRDYICRKLEENKIFARKYFYPLTSSLSVVKGDFDSQLTPIAQTISNQVLTLPLYPDLQIEDVEKICNIILKEVQI